MSKSPGVEISEPTPYFGYVYMWCDTVRNQYYIGSHKGSIYDSYKSGSKWLNDTIKKRPNTMRMRILEYYYGNNREELYKIESKWLQFYDVEKNDKHYYNFKNQARGGMGPFKHKGKKRAEYTPGWVDNRIGKKLEEIYKDPDAVRNRLAKCRTDYFEKHGHGFRKGKKTTTIDPRKGKTNFEIYGYDRPTPCPPKPFIITIQEPDKSKVEIICNSESDFYEKLKMESSSMAILKRDGFKLIKRRHEKCRHEYTVGTILRFRFIDD